MVVDRPMVQHQVEEDEDDDEQKYNTKNYKTDEEEMKYVVALWEK